MNILPESEIPIPPPIQDNTLEIENQQLRNEISSLKSEIRDLKALNSEQQIEIQSLKDQIVSMTKEFAI